MLALNEKPPRRCSQTALVEATWFTYLRGFAAFPSATEPGSWGGVGEGGIQGRADAWGLGCSCRPLQDETGGK